MQAAEIRSLDTLETKLAQTGQDTVSTARALAITDNNTYEQAAEFLREVKRRAKQVADYWSPAKLKAKSAYQEIVDKEKAMLAPLAEAETIVKRNMGTYQQRLDAQRKKDQEQARMLQQQEADRLLNDAMASEGAGDSIGAEMSLAMAQVVEDMPATPVAYPALKASGTSLRKVWKVRVVDSALVPVEHAGIEIRPIDMSALGNLAKMTKGSIKIPGVEFYEDNSIIVRV